MRGYDEKKELIGGGTVIDVKGKLGNPHDGGVEVRSAFGNETVMKDIEDEDAGKWPHRAIKSEPGYPALDDPSPRKLQDPRYRNESTGQPCSDEGSPVSYRACHLTEFSKTGVAMSNGRHLMILDGKVVS